ncbi:hypothetical protein Dimus_008155, partial [Dionaea muscipula]
KRTLLLLLTFDVASFVSFCSSVDFNADYELDESDEMLSRGFKDQIYDVYRYLPPELQVSVSLYPYIFFAAAVFSALSFLSSSIIARKCR